ncbi:hypothetical protein EXW72_07020 [Pseudomonas sp. BCA14]|uniref:hypothetical protein n=1 Tax=unclassified Pseudomonas TaxID=196821 RepID=UPI00106E5580|nr:MULTISPECIES: hypothetical protein [unclassified Pseudomonas]TFF13973.1 hypothetical protein EXW70_05470 [Pseudomonas sp. JMN1]TFF15344.1 hypothetical protein EXW71_03570 [Pseudomonas sp. BCA17]TFF31751.1 hypothetical protein EXW72_07020 [Pseudomonas sp. BCA14]TFF32703.1 hypothetical protein EXW73_02820 [Pseudomonas sp. BCA13]
MKKLEISIIRNSLREKAIIEYERKTSTLSIEFSDGVQKTFTEIDVYTCFGSLRKEFSDVKFLCKGSKVNVYPSAMASQMSGGVVAYEVRIGDPNAELVRIFDYEENDLTNDINEQIAYRAKWTESQY